MIRRLMVFVAAACIFAPAARPYIRNRSFTGAFMKRNDFANVQFAVNAGAVPGLLNADGKLMITEDSDIMSAVQAAMAAWNAVGTSAARFAAPQVTTALISSNDGKNTIVIADSPAIRSLVGPSLTSQTLLAANSSGNLLDTDIVLNPVLTFSTTGAADTYDLQAVLTKALGNSLGANNSAVLGAALCFSTGVNSTVQQTLSPEDVAFVNAVYPAAGYSNFATISGTLSMNGSPLRNVLISLVDPTVGTALTGLTSYLDGSWSMAVPPGSYLIYAQPLTGPVLPYLLAITSDQAVDTNFQSGFLGGNGSPTPITVGAGDTANADFSLPLAADGFSSPLLFAFAAALPGSPSGITALFPQGYSQPTPLYSGQTMDFIVMGQGIDASMTDANILLLGPISLESGTVKVDRAAPLLLNGVSHPFMRFTVDVQQVSAQGYATVVIVSNSGGIASYTGGIVLVPAQ